VLFRAARNLRTQTVPRRKFGDAVAAPRRVKAKVEEEVDVEIAWDSVIYRSFFFFGYVICPLVIWSGGKSEEPKKSSHHH
jgi:hypothetical protein